MAISRSAKSLNFQRHELRTKLLRRSNPRRLTDRFDASGSDVTQTSTSYQAQPSIHSEAARLAIRRDLTLERQLNVDHMHWNGPFQFGEFVAKKFRREMRRPCRPASSLSLESSLRGKMPFRPGVWFAISQHGRSVQYPRQTARPPWTPTLRPGNPTSEQRASNQSA